ncbi:putative ankyrin repeat domain-containing protein 20A12 [Camelus dromedarius]|uniref:Putative ankyrin repeat domain-containing protein 20A12 n=2 Tax=Camelus dromedarius TaxID=9838 RepID=A0A5N4C4Q4_CAMDR|nr:putative ankyrin repeat domain-containing protein 20A12 [Camelus dromedarius]
MIALLLKLELTLITHIHFPADLDLEMASKEEQEGRDGSENNQSQIDSGAKVKEKMNSVDGLDDLTLSPETASEDCESLYPNYKNTLRLIERLGLECKDYVTLLKIQNAVHSLRRLIECKESDCELLREKVKKMENKVNKLQKELLETRHMNSQLERQNVVWERELCSMRLCELQSENMLLRQQLEVAQNEAKSKKTINIPAVSAYDKAWQNILMLEEGNKELINDCKCVKDRMYQYETDRAEMQACVRRLQQELTDTRKKVFMLEASLEVTTARHQTNVENKTQDLERKLHQIADQNADLIAKLVSTTSALLHLSAETQLLLKELLCMKGIQKKCETLEEEKKKLEEEVVNLKRHLEVNTVERSPVEQYKRETEERARRDVAEKWKELSQVVQYNRETEARARQDVAGILKEISQFVQTQAAYEENLLRAYKNASISQMKHKIKYLESVLLFS